MVDKARLAFEDLVAQPGQEALRSGLKTARGILVFPAVIKVGVVLGGSGGTGVLLVRGDDDNWSLPAFYTLGAMSVGLQIGGQSAEVVILASSRKAVDSLLSNSVKLGGEVSVAVGPVGAGKAGNVTADFVSYTQAKGAFFGVSIEGSVLDVRDSRNHAYYGKAARRPTAFSAAQRSPIHQRRVAGSGNLSIVCCARARRCTVACAVATSRAKPASTGQPASRRR